ncbi:alpha/beta hydrolase [Cytobacillus suaedae]|nr:alpha/beta hydrolase [Cytobacillus suaedae]
MLVIESGVANINEASIYYEIVGNGKPLLLIHGLPIDSRMWDGQFEELSKQYKVIRFDLPGYGKSGAHDNDFSFVEDLKGLLDYLHIETVSIIGLSIGGQIGIDFSLDYPEKVESIVLVSNGIIGWTDFSTERKQFNEKINLSYQEGNLEKTIELMCNGWVMGPNRNQDMVSKDVVNLFSEMVKETYAKEAKGKGRMLFPEKKAIERVEEIKIPTLLVTSEYDFPEFRKIAIFLHEKIEDSKITMIPGTAHMLNMEKPKEFNETVLDFLSEVYLTNKKMHT